MIELEIAYSPYNLQDPTFCLLRTLLPSNIFPLYKSKQTFANSGVTCMGGKEKNINHLSCFLSQDGQKEKENISDPDRNEPLPATHSNTLKHDC